MDILENIARNTNEFKRTNLNPLNNAIIQMSIMAEKRFGLNPHDAERRVRRLSKDKFHLKNPTVTYYKRSRETLDRNIEKCGVNNYMQYLMNNDVIVAPSGTSYVKRKVCKSICATISEEGMAERKIVKGKSFVAINEGDSAGFDFYNGRSNGIKLDINSLSGALVSFGSILRNRSAHNGLTSNAATTVSASNILAEYMNGSRYYNSYEVVQSAILSLLQSLRDPDNYEQDKSWSILQEQYNLHIPTVDEIMIMVKASCKWYWDSNIHMSKLVDLMNTLTDRERVAFMYTGDMYNFYKYNPKVGATLYNRLSSKPDHGLIEGAAELVKKMPDDVMNHCHHLLIEEMKGLGTDYKTMSDEIVSRLVRGANQVMNTLFDYKLLLQTILCSNYFGPNIVHMYDMVRQHIPASDTDSTVMSVSEMVALHRGDYLVNNDAIRVGSSHGLLFGQALDNTLIQIATNMNAEEKYKQTMKMKAELTTTVIGVGSRSKQYFTNSTVLEGNVMAEPDLVVKGKELKSTTIPAEILKVAKARMADCIHKIENNVKISMHEMFIETLRIERTICEKVVTGNLDYFDFAVIKDRKAYSDKVARSPFDWSTFFDSTLGKAYGMTVPVPFTAVKFSTDLRNKTKLNDWVRSIPDPALQASIGHWLGSNKKTMLKTIYIPIEFVQEHGIPSWMLDTIDVHKIILNIVKVMYRVLEICGFNKSKDLTLSEAILGTHPRLLVGANITELVTS